MERAAMKLTKHQKRILATLAKMAECLGHQWWGRSAIGEVVAAGGFHAVIQTRTMLKLRELGLVMLERQSWPAEVQALVRCNCGMYHWGLTQAGRELASTIKVAWPSDISDRVRIAACHDNWRCEGNGDGDGDLWVWKIDDDDSDDDFQEPREPSPSPMPCQTV